MPTIKRHILELGEVLYETTKSGFIKKHVIDRVTKTQAITKAGERINRIETPTEHKNTITFKQIGGDGWHPTFYRLESDTEIEAWKRNQHETRVQNFFHKLKDSSFREQEAVYMAYFESTQNKK